MFLTAKQLEDLYRQGGGNGHFTLPYRARLTPLAVDWIRAKKVILGYSSVATPTAGIVGGDVPQGTPSASAPAPAPASGSSPVNQGTFLYWCDGPCGPAKAAVVAYEREANLRPLDRPADAKQTVGVIKSLVLEIKAGRAVGGILLVQHGAAALVFANRCPTLRAVLGTCLESVEQGIRQVAANVLVIEYPYKTLQQVKNMLGRFVRAPRNVSEELGRQIQELASCG